MLRPVPIRRYLTVMQAKGFDAQQVLEGSGIAVDSLNDPHYLIDVPSYRCVVENVVRLAGDDGIGLDMGLARQLGDFGVLGHAALACRTVRHSMEEFWGRYGAALGMMAKIAIPKAKSETLTLDIVAVKMSPPTYRFFVEEALFLIQRVGGQVSGTQPHFEKLQFSYPAPSYHARYRQQFDCPIRFGAEHTRVTLSRTWLEQPLETADDELLRLYQQHLEQLQREIETSSPARMRLRSIFLKLGGKIPALEDAARELGFSPRTLRRQLQSEGVSYRRLVEEFRLELTLECFKSNRMNTKQISERVGFDDVNAFRSAFKKWTGKTIGAYRQEP